MKTPQELKQENKNLRSLIDTNRIGWFVFGMKAQVIECY